MNTNKTSSSPPTSWRNNSCFSFEEDEESQIPMNLSQLHTNNTNNAIQPHNEQTRNEIGNDNIQPEHNDITTTVNKATNSKRRGRPPGAKNKPKVDVNTHVTSNMNQETHEIPPETDVIKWIVQYAESKQLSVTVESGSGEISLVDLAYGNSNDSPVTISGRFTLISFSGVFLTFSLSPGVQTFFNVSYKTPDDRIFGGEVTGRMIASSPVVLKIYTCNNPKFYELRN